jgi:hypothetical protein
MRRAVLLGIVVLLAAACSTTRQTIATPYPSLEPISDFFARLSPRPSVSPSTSPSPSAAAQSVDGTSRPAARSAPASGANSRVVCPGGRVAANLTDVTSTDTGDPPSSNGDHRYDVSVSGNATNNAGASVRAVDVAVTLHANNERPATYDVTVPQTIAPGQTIAWSGRVRYRGGAAPDDGGSYASVAGWSWADSSLASCPV